MTGYIYLINCNDLYKIGIAADFETRLADLQTGNPYPLKMILNYQFKNPRAIETVLHDRFENVRVLGEWFRLTDPDIEQIRQVCELLNGRPYTESMIVSEADLSEADAIGDGAEKEVAPRAAPETIAEMRGRGLGDTAIIAQLWGVTGGRRYTAARAELAAIEAG